MISTYIHLYVVRNIIFIEFLKSWLDTKSSKNWYTHVHDMWFTTNNNNNEPTVFNLLISSHCLLGDQG